MIEKIIKSIHCKKIKVHLCHEVNLETIKVQSVTTLETIIALPVFKRFADPVNGDYACIFCKQLQTLKHEFERRSSNSDIYVACPRFLTLVQNNLKQTTESIHPMNNDFIFNIP